MKSLKYLFLIAAMTLCFGASAEVILEEDFENTPYTTSTNELPAGWTKQETYTGPTMGYHWTIGYSATGSTMSGHHYLYIDAPTYVKADRDGIGPRREVIMTPEILLDGTCQLAFDWECAAYSCLTKGEYKLQVIVMTEEGNTIIFDNTDEQMVRDSGVPADPYGQYLWENWGIHTSKIDLSAWADKTVKIGFVFNMLKQSANILYLDNILIKQYVPLTGPIPQLSESTYQFPDAYIGEMLYSEVMTLKNVGLAGLKVTGFDAPTGVGLAMDMANVNLGINETAPFQLVYKADLATPTEGDVVIHTNGGDATLHFTATKQVVPEGYTLELFEGDQFPPAGWERSNGINQWASSPYAIEGDKSMIGYGYIEDSWINTPRLDLSDPEAPHEFMFTYYSQFADGDETIPGNDLQVLISTNGGKFTKIWEADYEVTNTLVTASINLSAFDSDSVVLRFNNTAVYFDSEYGMDPSSNFIIDRVLLPNIYGADGVPAVSTLVAPLDSATNVYAKNIKLQWSEAQFAEGYRLYVGTTENTFDVINGEDMGTNLSYTLATALPATTYRWKVVPYNSVGDAENVPTWIFTTQPDQTITEFPWNEGFENGFAPLGWFADNTKLTKWTASDYYPFDGKRSAMATSNETEVTTTLTTPDIVVPQNEKYQLSFWWGNDRPVSLTKDDSQVHVNHSTREDGIDAVFFDVFVDGAWQQLALMSDNSEGEDNYGDPIRYWCYESVDLAPYAGKTIAFRWRYISHNYGRSRGASVDNVKIDAAGAAVSFSVDNWDAYRVNAAVPETSGSIAMTNLGSDAVTIESVTFADDGFSTSLANGTEVPASGSVQFTITYNAKGVAKTEPVEIEDEMTVTMSDGTTATLPVNAIALPLDYQFYGFEHDATGECPEGFTVINVDGASCSPLTFWTFPNNGGMLSFFVLNDSQCYNSLKEPHGHQSLMTRCTSGGTFKDWIVSNAIVATESTEFSLDLRNWESINSVMPAGCPTVRVLVSTTSATNRNSFTQVGESYTPELFDDVNWDHISFDLGEYAGKRIYVAVEAEATDCLGAFYDNFEFAHLMTPDVNHDGFVNVTDVNLIVSAILNGEYIADYDINGDGGLTVTDINLAVSYILSQH